MLGLTVQATTMARVEISLEELLDKLLRLSTQNPHVHIEVRMHMQYLNSLFLHHGIFRITSRILRRCSQRILLSP
jgi:hypothetical protein